MLPVRGWRASWRSPSVFSMEHPMGFVIRSERQSCWGLEAVGERAKWRDLGMAKQLCSPCGLHCLSRGSFCQRSAEGVNSVAQGKELPAPISWRGHVWLTQQWGCSRAQSSGNGAVSSAASLLQSSVAIPSAQQHLLFLLGQGGKETVGEEEVTNLVAYSL